MCEALSGVRATFRCVAGLPQVLDQRPMPFRLALLPFSILLVRHSRHHLRTVHMAAKNLFHFPVDGIRPEAMAEVKKLIAAMNGKFGTGFVTDEGLVGGCAYDVH